MGMTKPPHKGGAADLRPVSPHLQIYRWQWTMALSITHRLTGLYISVGIVFLCLKIIVLGFFEAEHFAMLTQLSDGKVFLVFKAFFVWCLLYHMLNGVRHLFWDTGRGLGLRTAALSGYTSALLSLLLTALYWRYWF